MQAERLVDELLAVVYGLQRQSRTLLDLIAKSDAHAADHVMDRFVTTAKVSVIRRRAVILKVDPAADYQRPTYDIFQNGTLWIGRGGILVQEGAALEVGLRRPFARRDGIASGDQIWRRVMC